MTTTSVFFFIIMVACFSDIILNYISHQTWSTQTIRSLKPYFDKRGPIKSSIYAGLTVLVVLLFTCLLSYALFGYAMPKTINQLYMFLLLAFPIGFISDIVINRYKIFGTDLDAYYNIAGEGLWGALAFIFAIIIGWISSNQFTDRKEK